MSKYIIDTETWANLFEVQRVGVYGIGNDIVTDEKTVWSRMFSLDELEELNSDYINENYGSMQDEAYRRGLEDAWEAAKKIFGYEIDGGIPIDKIGRVFGYSENETFCTADIIRHNTASEAIAKLKAYEDKHSDRIEVGDIVDVYGNLGVITYMYELEACVMMVEDGSSGNWNLNELKKTGKHYDIASILEAMRK